MVIDHAGSNRPPSPAPAPPQTSTQSGQSVRFPWRFDDYLPVMRTTLAHIPSKEKQIPQQAIADQLSQSGSDSLGNPTPDTGVEEDSGSQVSGDVSPLDHSVTTKADCFGVYRVYARKPLCDPLRLAHTVDPTASDSATNAISNYKPVTGPPSSDIQSVLYYHPFSNLLAAAMMVTHHSGTPVQSLQKTTQIAHILGTLGSDLDASDLGNFNATVENKSIDSYLSTTSGAMFHCEDGWLNSSIQIHLPLDKKKMLETDATQFEVRGIYHRDIIDVISSVYQSDVVQSFNLILFKEFWTPSEGTPPERLYGEIFSSQMMLNIDNDICKRCLEVDLDPHILKTISVPILLYSDSTHLANFGTASSWLIYLFFGSQSKYVHNMPTLYACHHIAYMPSVHEVLLLYLLRLMMSQVTGQHTRLLQGTLWDKHNGDHPHALQKGTYPCNFQPGSQ